MKARNKETGEIKELLYDETKHLLYSKEGDTTIYYLDGYEPVGIDWEQRRWELVKAAMQGFVSIHSPGLFDKNLLAALSVDYADTVLAEYRKGGE